MRFLTRRLVWGAAVFGLAFISPTSPAAAQPNGPTIIPSEEAVLGMLRALGLRGEAFPVDRGDWSESAGYTVPDEQDVVNHTIVVYAATLPSASDARNFYLARGRQLELDNETTHAWNTPRADNLGADDSRDFRLVYVDIASRSRSGEYARIVRRGPIVGLVEVVGSPALDDEGIIDEDRQSIMVGIARLLMSRMAQQPIMPTNEAMELPFGLLHAGLFGIATESPVHFPR